MIIKGKTAPVRVYTPCSDTEICRLADAALDAFQARAWDTAEAHLQVLQQRCPADLASQRLRVRIAEARSLPPDDALWSPAIALDKL